LGIDDFNRAILDREITKPNGLLVVTGPTGSGKTTTLYSILNKLNSSENKIITVEDPIEYKLAGINQSEVKEEKGYTFAKALRSLVRQDPDIILVGEIRDEETVEIVLNAALTGHLVLSTIHTNSAAGTIPRFMALGAKPYLLSPAINVAISQRLVRRVCVACKEPEIISEVIKERLKEEANNMPSNYRNIINSENFDKIIFYKGRGCRECSGLGYKGQIGIFEILRINDEIKTMILSGEISEQQIKQVAVKEGMVSLVQDGILKAAKGIISLEEVFRVA
jgi:type II secretory ATPase GspE/PulE/Tfp pilus assembly ATPase PilB-like protein